MASKRALIILVLFGLVLSYVAGIFTANYTISYGVVDLLAGMPDRKVILNTGVELHDGKGNRQVLPKGTVLTWEGAQGGEYYLSIRYILNDASTFDLLENDNTFDFIQED